MRDLIIKWDDTEIPLFTSEDFIVESVENLSWASTELSLATNPYRAGDIINNARGLARDISVTIKPLETDGNFNNVVHKFARLVNQNVKLIWKNRVIPSLTKQAGSTAYWVDLETDLVISGVVNEFDTPRFNNDVRITFNVHCENPYWETVNPIEVDTFTGSILTPFCAYTEVKTGLSIEIPNLTIGNAGDYIDIVFSTERTGTGNDIKWMIEIKPIRLDGPLTFAYVKVTFDNGKVKFIAGPDEAHATDYTSLFKWSVLRAQYVPYSSPETYNYVTVNEFPELFPSSEEYGVYATKNTTQIATSIYFKPRFV